MLTVFPRGTMNRVLFSIGNRISNFIILIIVCFSCSLFVVWHGKSGSFEKVPGSERNAHHVFVEQRQERVENSASPNGYIVSPLNIHFESQLDIALPQALQDALSSAMMFERIPLLPLNASVVDRLFTLDAQIIATADDSYAFGVPSNHWLDLQKSMVPNSSRQGHCRCVNISEWCLVLRCLTDQVGDVFLYKLHNETNYWTIRTCLGDRRLLAFKILASSIRLTSSNLSITLPHDLRLYQTFAQYSQFLECDYQSARAYREKYRQIWENSTAAPYVKEASIVHFAELRDLLHSLRMTPFLCGGTLLGWRRECGIIKYTSDFDFCVPISQYNEGLEAILANHAHFTLKYRFGKPSDSLEYTVYDRNGARMDIFFLYEESDHSWVGGMGPRRMKLKYTYPKVASLCVVDLLGHLFHVPCNLDAFIMADYGPNWTTPIHQDSYIWYSSSHSVTRLGTWPQGEAEDIQKVF